MPIVKVTTWNIERMHQWFNGNQSNVKPSFQDVASKVANVIKTIDPQILCIQEGPRLEDQLRSYLNGFVGGNWNVFGSETIVQQRPYIAYRDFSGLTSVDEIDFDATAWRYPFLKHNENSGTYSKTNQKFTRLPVELIFHTTKGGFSVVCLHLKSKFNQKANQANSSDPEVRTIAIAEGLEQRARILQEGKLIREYMQDHPFDTDVSGRTIVMGDLNDGPGVGFFELRFFGLDILRRVRGDIDHLDRLMVNVVEKPVEGDPQFAGEEPFSAIFFDQLDKQLRRVLLDHILIPPQFLASSGLRVDASSGKVEHARYLAENTGDWSTNSKPDRKTYPSDHRPASVLVKF